MTKLRITTIALCLVVVALTLGSCGDDGGSKQSATTGADATETTTGTADTTGTTKTYPTQTGKSDKTDTRKRDDKGGTNGGSGGGSNGSSGGGSDDSSGSGGGGNSGSSPEKELTGKNVERTSKTVCSQFLPTALERSLKSGDKSPEDIAKDYSRAYPSAERQSAYDGCLAGLKTKE